MQQDNLDNFIMENGSELKDNIQIVDTEPTTNNEFHLAYDTDKPVPGNVVADKINGIENINKQTALDSLIIKSALIKAENEAKKSKGKLSKKERESKKKQFVDSLMYQQEEDYYQKHHYMMDGKTKRGVRKRIERNFDKGRYDKYLLENRKSLNG